MRLEPHANTHPRLLRKATLADEGPLAPPPVARARGAKGTTEDAAPPAGTKPNKAAPETTGAKAPEPPPPPRKQAAPRSRRKSKTEAVIAEPVPTAAPEPPKSRRPRGRFVEAAHLDEAKKQRIAKALAERRIGDDMGRAIFIGALEYQMSAFAGRLQRRDEIPTPPEPRRDEALEQALASIAAQSRALADQLRELPDAPKEGLTAALTVADRFARGYDTCYLRELGCELERLERACAATTVPEEPALPVEDPAPSRPFVAKLAKIFAECFEMAPTADEDGPFRAALEVLDAETGLVIGHSPEFLAEILSASAAR